jgi:lysozyme family protein
MTSSAVQSVIARVLQAEGGIKDVGDGKGVTRFGQTPGWLEDNGFVPPSNAADAAVNYETWMRRFKFDRIADLDPFLGWMVTDFAVHSGEETAIKVLQRALVVRDDGILGPVTFRSLQLAARTDSQTSLLAHKFVAHRMRYIGELLGSKKVDRRQYAHGWLNRLADQVEELP